MKKARENRNGKPMKQKPKLKEEKMQNFLKKRFLYKKNLDPQMHVQQENNNATVADEVNPELLAKVLANPEMRALLNSLAKTMK